jgi:acetyltransferase-like isoleucine patch superfamily enzyme
MVERSSGGLWMRVSRKTVYEWINLAFSLWPRFKARFYYPFIFGSFGRGSLLYKPIFIGNPKYIHIGRGVRIAPGARLETIFSRPGRLPQLIIGDNVNLEQGVHIVCHNRIVIESDVSVTGFCSIVDTTHPVDGLCPDDKMGRKIIDDDASVEIGRGTFIGMGARILPGVHIGRGAVIGTNAVVTHDVPEFGIASGVPAEVRRLRRLSSD